jgi:hypothetical protein
MAPVAGGITNGQKHRFIQSACLVKCLVTPWVPVDGVMGVLQQVGRIFIYKTIRKKRIALLVDQACSQGKFLGDYSGCIRNQLIIF